jgi:hypothetical protein
MNTLKISSALTEFRQAKPNLPRATELFSVIGESQESTGPEHIVVCGEETGGTDALMPVIQELLKRNIGVTALLAGNGLRALMTRGAELGLRAVPLEAWPEAADNPSGVVITPSEDGRLEEYLLDKYKDKPVTVIEDYHESSRRAIAHAARLGIEIPTVCVVDNEAERLIRKRFPDLSVPVVKTGSPTFDRLLKEDVPSMRRHMKRELEIPEENKFVAFLIPRLGKNSLLLASDFAKAIRGMSEDIIFTARRHPSDTIDCAAYDEIFEGLDLLDTSATSTDKVAEAADLIIAQRSVTILRAATRQQPTITLTRFTPEDFTLPLVDSRASLPIQAGKQLPSAITELLEGESARCDELRANMKPYKTDGKAASGVADVVCR